MAREVMLSTIDNPYNPFDDFDKWYAYDIEHGYNSCGLLARIAPTSDELPENFVAEFIEDSIDNFLSLDCLHLFVKVVRS